MKALKTLAVLAVLIGTQAFSAGSIVKSKHNLSFEGIAATSANPGGSNTVAATTGSANGEICVFCHTPHGSSSSFTGAPLWNKAASATVKYVVYGSPDTADITTAGTTIGGSTLTANTVNSASRACLSCHDGVSAINSLVNAPGAGLGNGGTDNLPAMGATAAGSDYLMPAGITNIGRFDTNAADTDWADLRNDHPVSIVYTDGKASLVPISGDIGAGSLKSDGTAYDNTIWTTPSGAKTIAAILRGTDNTYVECGTCHDPHLGPTAGTQELFLRTGTNAGSQLCLGCHAK